MVFANLPGGYWLAEPGTRELRYLGVRSLKCHNDVRNRHISLIRVDAGVEPYHGTSADTPDVIRETAVIAQLGLAGGGLVEENTGYPVPGFIVPGVCLSLGDGPLPIFRGHIPDDSIPTAWALRTAAWNPGSGLVPAPVSVRSRIMTAGGGLLRTACVQPFPREKKAGTNDVGRSARRPRYPAGAGWSRPRRPAPGSARRATIGTRHRLDRALGRAMAGAGHRRTLVTRGARPARRARIWARRAESRGSPPPGPPETPQRADRRTDWARCGAR